MKKEDLLNDDFLKQFKTAGELNSFLQQLQKRAVEKMLEGELDAHLGYGKHQNSDNPNSRNGYSTKTIKNAFGEAEIKVPRDRDGSFEPALVPKRKSMAEGVMLRGCQTRTSKTKSESFMTSMYPLPPSQGLPMP